MIKIGMAWFLVLVVGLNIVYALRDRTRWARSLANLIRQMGVRHEDSTLLVWVIIADFLLALAVIAFILEASVQ